MGFVDFSSFGTVCFAFQSRDLYTAAFSRVREHSREISFRF